MSTFIQWNINGFYNRSVDINRIVYNFQPLILCFQETNLKDTHTAHIKNYSAFFKNRSVANRASGGVATFVSNSLESENIPIISDLEVVATLVKFQKHLCIICNIYIPDSKKFTKQNLIDIIRQLPKPFLLLGDFNSRNVSWGCSHTDDRGKMVEELLDDENLFLLNNNEPTRHNIANGTFSAIDLSITNLNSASLLEWQVLTSYNSSDHWPIGIQFLDHSPPSQLSTHWNLQNPNWELYSELIEHDLSNNPIDFNCCDNQVEIDSIVKLFTDIIIEAANKSIGLKTNLSSRKKNVPWWNKDCHEAILNFKKKLNRYKKTKSCQDHILLKNARARSRFITKNSKTLSWQEFTSSINQKTSPKIIWNKINSLKGNKFKTIPDILYYNQDKIVSTPNASESFAHFFQKNNSDENYDLDFISYRNANNKVPELSQTNVHYNLCFDISELTSTLQSCTSKSPGPDNIPYIFLKNLPVIGTQTLLHIYNTIWTKGLFPSQRRNANVIPIPKLKITDQYH